MTEEIALLKDYAATGSQSAFAELARRYIDLVYSAAKRQVYNDAHTAEDVTQAVFVLLSQKARSIPADRPLSSWLMTVTAYCASNARRKRNRRETHEGRAAEMAASKFGADPADAEWRDLAPLLDQGINKLRAADRDAILLRFMEHKTLRQVAEALGISEEAAQKRVTRAVDRLRDFFHGKGVVTMSAGALGAALASHSVHAAPTGLLTSVAAGASAAAAPAAGASLAKGALLIMATEKIKIAAIVLLLLLLGGGVATGLHAMLASPHAHTVTLKPEKPPADSRSSITFSDGSNVRVLGMTEAANAPDGGIVNGLLSAIGISSSHPSTQPTKWWRADGTTAAPVSLAGLGTVSVGDMPGHRQLRFVFALTGPHFMDGSLDIRVPGTSGSGESSNFIGGENRINLVVSLPAKTEQTAIRLGWATGPWHDDVVTPIADLLQPAPTTRRSAGAIEYGEVTDDHGRTVVEVIRDRRSIGDASSRVAVILKDGKEVGCSEWNSSMNLQSLKFAAPLARSIGSSGTRASPTNGRLADVRRTQTRGRAHNERGAAINGRGGGEHETRKGTFWIRAPRAVGRILDCRHCRL